MRNDHSTESVSAKHIMRSVFLTNNIMLDEGNPGCFSNSLGRKISKACQVMVTSTPEGSQKVLNDSEISIIPPQSTCPVMVSDTSADIEQSIAEECDCHQQNGLHTIDVHQQPISPDPDRTQSPRVSSRKRKLLTKEQLMTNNIETSNPNSNNTDISRQSCDKSTTSERNMRLLDGIKKKLGLCRQQSKMTKIGTQTESITSNNRLDISSSTHKLSTKRSAQIQIPQRAHKSDYCDLSATNSYESAMNCAQAQSLEIAGRNDEIEQQCLDNDEKHELVPCLCSNTDCLHERGNNPNDETSNVKPTIKGDSGGAGCAGVCEQYYRNKLMATLQILENKEETIRVQGSSLGVAEARIAALTERACALRRELDSKARELDKLRKFAQNCRVEKTDVSITAEMQEVENQKNIVNTLQDNLSVLAELYRECFYETAKQEEFINLMRKSYLDVRLMDKDKLDKINRLQNVINTQKWSIEQCQDVVIEVENLKSEISCFLSSSNNDSGMWERGSESPDVSEELGDILDQLRQLQDMLTGDCTCGLQEENMALKKKNENLEIQVDKLKQRVGELQETVSSKHCLDLQYQAQIEEKEQEFQEIRRRLAELECGNRDQTATCETLSLQLQQSQVLLRDKRAELVEAQLALAARESAVHELQHQLDEADRHAKENLKKFIKASQWKTELDESQARVLELERQLQGTCARCQQLEEFCREKDRSAAALQSQLQEAFARGAKLCEESGRVTACVRHWMRRQRALAREQQEKIKIQESMLSELQRCVEARQNHSVRTSPSETDPCCSKYISLHASASETTSYPRFPRAQLRSGSEIFSQCGTFPRTLDRESEMASCSKCASNRRERSSDSEMASCSSAPVPPRRQKKKLPPCGDILCPWVPGSPRSCRAPPPRCPLPREPSPTEEIIERVELLHDALAAGQRRWGRARR